MSYFADDLDVFENTELTIYKKNKCFFHRNPEDVDLYTGALSEYPIHGGIVGPLLACLIGDQFVRMKFGDSHWYERQHGPQKFTDCKYYDKHLLFSLLEL
jgi:hypothetical protein